MDQSSQLSRLEAGADGGAVGEGKARGALWWDEGAGMGVGPLFVQRAAGRTCDDRRPHHVMTMTRLGAARHRRQWPLREARPSFHGDDNEGAK